MFRSRVSILLVVGPWLSTTAFAQTISVTGICPGTLDVTVMGMTAGGQVAIVAGFPGGSGVLAGGACAGTSVDVGNPVLRGKAVADSLGVATLNPTVQQFTCGRAMQGVDLTTCATTPPTTTPPVCVPTDFDQDAVDTCHGDCDDADPTVNPDAVEVCGDGVDNDCSGTDRSCSPIGEFQVQDGPQWGSDPRVVSCIEACASIFGGTHRDYHCSVDPAVLDFTSFVSGWGDGTFCTTPVPEDFSREDPANPGYNCASFGCAYSAYVTDWCFAGETNYCWEH